MLIPIQRIQPCHLIFAQIEIEYVGICLDSGFSIGFRKRDEAVSHSGGKLIVGDLISETSRKIEREHTLVVETT